jgi:hypothetical protein
MALAQNAGVGGSPSLSPQSTAAGNTTTQNKQYTKSVSPIKRAKTYYPSSYYKASSGTGASAGGGAKDYESYGITPDWMEAYKGFWGQNLPEQMWGVYQPAVNLFSRYAGRLPQLTDWAKMWSNMRASNAELANMWKPIELYEPMIANRFTRPPLFTPPAVTYSPTMSF